MEGGTPEYTLSDLPNFARGVSDDASPYSLTTD
jgi:putative alpha-1,2-mannosidase